VVLLLVSLRRSLVVGTGHIVGKIGCASAYGRDDGDARPVVARRESPPWVTVAGRCRSATASGQDVANVGLMTGGAQSDSSGATPDPDLPGARSWQHPSEVGQAVRGRTDRRRSAALAAGVVLGGIGLLVTGMLLGSAQRDDGDGPSTMDRVSRSVVHVTTVNGTETTMLTGLVIDDTGHVLVPADAVLDVQEVWARCNDGEPGLVDVVASDPTSNLALLRLVDHTGEPAAVEEARPEPGTEVMTVRALKGSELSVVDATVESDGEAPSTTTASGMQTLAIRPHQDTAAPTGGGSDDAATGLLFDAAGRFLGMTSASGDTSGGDTRVVELMPASAALLAAQRLLPAD